MSCYNDIYNDYPLRCATIWESFDKEAAEKKLEVTFMLMCAAGGFVMPWEHLKIQAGQSDNNSYHPSFIGGDERSYKKSLVILEKALEGTLSESPLFRQIKVEKCFYGHAETIGLIRDKVDCRNLENIDFTVKKSRDIVKILRHALAHNNIYGFSYEQDKEISQLAFFSEVIDRSASIKKVEHYEIIVMGAEDFRAFLSAWFKLLRSASRKNVNFKQIMLKLFKDNDHDERITA